MSSPAQATRAIMSFVRLIRAFARAPSSTSKAECDMSRPLALVTGVGPGTGSAIARRLSAGGYDVAMLARNGERLAGFESEIANARAFACDVTDEAQLDAALAAVRQQLGEPAVLVHNAVGGAWGSFLDIDPKVLNANFQVNTMALLHLARRLAPAMVQA